MRSILLPQFALLAFTLFLIPPDAAFACPCENAVPVDYQQEIAKADFIFAGKATQEIDGGSMSPTKKRRWRFEVAQVWKGPTDPVAFVYAHSETGERSDCDFLFEIGKVYVVFANSNHDQHWLRYQAKKCTATTVVSKDPLSGHNALRALGNPRSARPGEEAGQRNRGSAKE